MNGTYFTAVLGALRLARAHDTRRNAAEIVSAIMSAYGTTRSGRLQAERIPDPPITGLVYGRIQSGKTRAMIASTALAFDNGFRIAVVMTSNINDLVSQTHTDFSTGLQQVMIHTKDTYLAREVESARMYIEQPHGRLLLICSKGGPSLRNISQFLQDIGAARYPAIIFDDEGDQASLDTNTRRRTGRRTRSRVRVAPSAINDIIQSRLRASLARHVYVSVTGTPQAVLLQSADSTHRPSFIVMLPPGRQYVGGDRFFRVPEPEDNRALIAVVATNEQQQLLDEAQAIPDGLKRAILFYLLSAAAALINRPAPERGYSFLCHPGLRNEEQAIAERRITSFLNEVLRDLFERRNSRVITTDFPAIYEELESTLGEATPPLDVIYNTLIRVLPLKRLLVINATVRRQGIDYGPGLNILIGGNTLGRGIAIRDLLVTYYVRNAQISQIDTMHQHARMYGYRAGTLPYTRLFIPRHLYHRFRDIYNSDEELREFIEQHQTTLPNTFPIEFTFNLRATRQGVLDARRVDVLRPGMQIYPNHITIPQEPRAYGRILGQLRIYFDAPNTSAEELERIARRGVEINSDSAAALIRDIRTESTNTWRDSTISAVIEKVSEHFRDRILLKFRTANRRIDEEGLLPTGTLYSGDLMAARGAEMPTLWIMSVETTEDSHVGAGRISMYPTFVIPNAFGRLFLFNRG